MMLSSLIQSHAEHYSDFEGFVHSVSSPMTKHSTNRKQSLYKGLWGWCCQQPRYV